MPDFRPPRILAPPESHLLIFRNSFKNINIQIDRQSVEIKGGNLILNDKRDNQNEESINKLKNEINELFQGEVHFISILSKGIKNENPEYDLINLV